MSARFWWRLLGTGLKSLLLLISLALALLLTPAGGRWLLMNGIRLLPANLSIDETQGSLYGDIQLTGIRYRDDYLTVEVRSAELIWSPLQLLRGRLLIDAVRAEGVQLKLKPGRPAKPEEKSQALTVLPVTVDVSQLVLEDADLELPGQPLRIDALHLAAHASGDHVSLQALDFITPQGQISAQAELALTAPHPMNAEVRWQAVRWPLASGERVLSPQGSLQVQGNLDRFEIRGQAQAGTDRYPSMNIQLAADGNSQQILLQSLSADMPGGQLDVHGTVTVQPQLRWDLNLDGKGINPGVFLPDYPGLLSVQADSRGVLSDTGPMADLHISRLGGKLRQRALALSSTLTVDGQDVHVRSLNLSFGTNRVAAQGDLHAGQVNGSAQLALPDPAAFVPEATGRLNADVQIHGSLPWPQARGHAEARTLKFGEYRVHRLDLDFDVDPAVQRASSLRLSAQGLAASGSGIDGIDLRVDGSPAAHKLDLAVASPWARLRLAASGHYADQRWDGRLQQLDLLDTQAGDWHLSAPVAVRASQQSSSLERACLISADGRLCLRAAHGTQTGIAGDAQIEHLALAVARPWMPEGLSVDGSLTAEAHVAQAPGKDPIVHVQLSLPSGVVTYRSKSEPEARFDWRSLQLVADAQEQRLRAHVGLVTHDNEGADIDLNLRQYKSPDAGLEGRVHAALSLPTWISAYTPDLEWKPGAQLRADARLGGTLQRPLVHGDTAFRAPAISVPRVGLEIKDIQLRAQAEGEGPVQLTGQAASGPGTLAIKGSVTPDAARGWPLDIQLTGRRFELARIPEMMLQASPDLHLSGNADTARLSGKVQLDTLAIEIKQLPKTAITVSDDQHIVGEQRAQGSDLLAGLRSQVQVDIPDTASLKGFGLDTHMRGRVAVHQEAGTPATLQGQLDLKDGAYQAFGQKLAIKRGRFIFNGPADNPGLDIQAEREAGDVTAGIQVSGTLKLPITNVYSRPALPENEALAYLLLGKPLSGATSGESDLLGSAALALGSSGANPLTKRLGGAIGLDELGFESSGGVQQAGVAVGKRLSNRLSLRYVYGLFDRVGSVLLQYQLTKSLSLEAHTGLAQQIDLLYKVERN